MSNRKRGCRRTLTSGFASPSATLALLCEADDRRQEAQGLALRLGLPLVENGEGHDCLLVLTAERLEARQCGAGAPGPVYVDFASGVLTYRRQHGGGKKEALARAAGVKAGRRPLILDATAGLGRDSFLLAGLGCPVMMKERSPLLCAMLEDGLRRAGYLAEFAPLLERLSLECVDARCLGPLVPLPEVIYLDPMYPHRGKSALVKKEMRLVRALVGDDQDAGELLSWALKAGAGRVVVKRPKGAGWLAGRAPSTVIAGGNSRFDIYLVAGR